MTKFLYFAYGSNMLRERLRAPNRCPSAESVGLAIARGWSLNFHKKSKDGSGKAMLTSCDGGEVYGVLYKISTAELNALNRAEGQGEGYNLNEEFAVERIGAGKTEKVATYEVEVDPKWVHKNSQPFCWYKALVIAGAQQNKIDNEYIYKIRLWQFILDKNYDRKSRKEAVDALTKAKFKDWQRLIEVPTDGYE